MSLPQPPQDRQKVEAALNRLDRLARLLDTRYRVPGIGIRFGWDGLIGLIPIAGDVVGGLLSLYFIYEAWRIQAPKPLLIKMGGNVAIELAGGMLPVMGDLFDIYWKSNRKNVVLLREHLNSLLPPETPPTTPSYWLPNWLIGILIVTGLIFSLYALVRFMYY